MVERVKVSSEVGHGFGLQLVASSNGEGSQEPSPSPSGPSVWDSQEVNSVGQPEPTSYKGDYAFKQEKFDLDPEALAATCVPFSAGNVYHEVS